MEAEILARARGRKRDEATQAAILGAAYDLIAAEGYRALTMEGVAAKSGAGKTTIYRWWPSKAALATDAYVSHLNEEAPDPDTGSAIQDLRIAMRNLARSLSGTSGQVLACILGGGRDDPQTLYMFKEKIAGPRRAFGRERLRAGIASGELRPDINVDVVLDALFLPIYVRLMMGLGPCDDEWVDELTKTVLSGIANPPSATSAALPDVFVSAPSTAG